MVAVTNIGLVVISYIASSEQTSQADIRSEQRAATWYLSYGSVRLSTGPAIYPAAQPQTASAQI